MIHPSLATNPIQTRADLERALHDLVEPLLPFFSPGGALVTLSGCSSIHSPVTEGMEAFTRPLWGLVPLTVGGGSCAYWEAYRRGLEHGTDPAHPEYWGCPSTGSLHHVEMAVIGFALAMVPEHIWTPLPPAARKRLNDWLLSINEIELPRNNWYFFRVLVNVGLRKVGARHDPAALEKTLDDIENYYVGDGWYADGADGPCDYYSSFALQYYSLIYAVIAGAEDPVRAQKYRSRAARFAQDFIFWQDGGGAMLPYGRSLTYRFAQASFWSALAFCGADDAPSLGVIKGMILRHLRGWLRKPIFTDAGTLSVGYGYPNPLMAEPYNGPGSPYWSLKTFLVLALPATHAFWLAEEAPLPELPPRRILPHAGMVVCRDHPNDLTVALCCGVAPTFHQWTAKYTKFAYAQAFGICVPVEGVGLAALGHDNALALSDDGDHWRVRRTVVRNGLSGETLWTQWKPWPDVEVTTWVWPEGAWHVRVHRVRTARALHTSEGGFSVARALTQLFHPAELHDARKARAGLRIRLTERASTVLDLGGGRRVEEIGTRPHCHLDHPHSAIPALNGELAPGEHWLAGAFLAERNPAPSAPWETAPAWDAARPPEALVALLESDRTTRS
jgi:hypothetical protein